MGPQQRVRRAVQGEAGLCRTSLAVLTLRSWCDLRVLFLGEHIRDIMENKAGSRVARLEADRKPAGGEECGGQ